MTGQLRWAHHCEGPLVVFMLSSYYVFLPLTVRTACVLIITRRREIRILTTKTTGTAKRVTGGKGLSPFGGSVSKQSANGNHPGQINNQPGITEPCPTTVYLIESCNFPHVPLDRFWFISVCILKFVCLKLNI